MGLQQTLKALADPIRREILNMLKKGRMSAGEITEHFSVTAPSISRHLSVLKESAVRLRLMAIQISSLSIASEILSIRER